MSNLNTKMTALADEVRVLSGATSTLGIEAMTLGINEANTQILSQGDIIASIKEAVETLPSTTDVDEKWLLRENTSYTNNTATNIGYGAFCYHQVLEEVNLPNVTTIDTLGFGYCDNLATINLPKLTSASGNYAFRNCTSLTSVSLPECTKINYGFINCSSLVSIDLPKIQSLKGTFQGCTALTQITLPESATYLDISTFQNCTSLMSVTLLCSTRVAKLVNVNAFAGTPIADSSITGQFGNIYVPESLVDSYKSATNWSQYADRITAITEE